MIEDLAKFLFMRHARDFGVPEREIEEQWKYSKLNRDCDFWTDEAKAVLAFIDKHSGGKASNQWLEAVWTGARQ